MIIGFLVSYFIGHPFPKQNNKIVSNLLKLAVVGLAFSMSWQQTIATGSEGSLITLCFITFTLGLAMLLSWQLKLPQKLSYLMGVGTAICGGSAIATVTPIIDAEDTDISVSIGVVFLLNAIALFIFPIIGQWLDLSQYEFGMWAAIAIHDTSSVVGAASSYGDEALQIATTVKLVRAFWILPVAVATVFLFRSNNKRVQVPWFILIFVVVVFTKDMLGLEQSFTSYIVEIAKALLVLALFFVGTSLPGINLKALGWKALALGITLWILVSVSSLLLIIS